MDFQLLSNVLKITANVMCETSKFIEEIDNITTDTDTKVKRKRKYTNFEMQDEDSQKKNHNQINTRIKYKSKYIPKKKKSCLEK